MNGLFLFIQISMIVQFSPSLTLGVTLGLVAVAIVASLVLSITTGQGGSRIKATGHAAPSGKSNTDQDQYWKLGIFYFNRHDPALFVEKRFGIGWTVNFARPIGWIILVSILVVAFGMSFVFN